MIQRNQIMNLSFAGMLFKGCLNRCTVWSVFAVQPIQALPHHLLISTGDKPQAEEAHAFVFPLLLFSATSRGVQPALPTVVIQGCWIHPTQLNTLGSQRMAGKWCAIAKHPYYSYESFCGYSTFSIWYIWRLVSTMKQPHSINSPSAYLAVKNPQVYLGMPPHLSQLCVQPKQ